MGDGGCALVEEDGRVGEIDVGRTLGKGAFSFVFKGTWSLSVPRTSVTALRVRLTRRQAWASSAASSAASSPASWAAARAGRVREVRSPGTWPA